MLSPTAPTNSSRSRRRQPPTTAAVSPHSSRADLDLSQGMTQELARLELLFEAIPLAFATFDADLKLVSANNRYRELTGLDSASSAHRPIYDAFPNALADLTDQIDNALDGVPVVAARIPFQTRAGRRLIEVTFTPLAERTRRVGGAGARTPRGLLFAGIDVTEREDLREDLARSVAQLE